MQLDAARSRAASTIALLCAVLAPAASACRASVPPARPIGPTAAKPECIDVTTPFTGTLCTPGDGRRHPALLLFGGSEGDDPMAATAEELMGRGYVAASVVYFGAPATPATLVDVPVEVAGGALAAVAARSDVDSSRLGVLGRSKGGEYALLVASTYSEVKAVVALVPSPFAWFGLGDKSMPTGCSWSRGGRPLPCLPQDPEAGRQIGQVFASGQPIRFRESNERSRANRTAVEAAFFPIERIRGPVLCLAGDDDQLWNTRAHCELAIARLREHRHPFADRMVSYAGAGHLFLEARNGPDWAMNAVPMGSTQMIFGGTPAADARAAPDGWNQIFGFLAGALGPVP